MIKKQKFYALVVTVDGNITGILLSIMYIYTYIYFVLKKYAVTGLDENTPNIRG